MSVSVDTISENPDFELENTVLKSCQICGRTFNPRSLERHEKVCEKTKKLNNRTVFNSFLQRAKEIRAVPVTLETKGKEVTKSKAKWKEEHENLLRVIRGGKNPQGEVLDNGLSPQRTIPSGYQQCPSCNRYFSEKAADRHISWCQEQKNRLPKTPPNSEALERLKARVKYRAPLPRGKNSTNLNKRLVRSADSVRESSSLRTHSSPPIPVRDTTLSKCIITNSKKASLNNQSLEKSVYSYTLNEIEDNCCCENNNNNTLKKKKAVKFKEIFPVYDKEKNKNLDMLAALRLRLSELSASDDMLEDYILKSDSTSAPQNNYSKDHVFPSAKETVRDSWTSDGEVPYSNSSSSDGSLPSLNHVRSTEKRMPRFCYNCGTKYPIVSAKYCCECGAQRFIFGFNDKHISVP